MPEMTDVAAPLVRLSPGDGQYFFGYYDLPAADRQGRHLLQQVAARDRFPAPGEPASLSWVALPQSSDTTYSPEVQPFGGTVAWNFQQGSMLQWLPQPDTCLYNTFRDGAFGCHIHNVVTGEQRRLPRAVTNVSQDGTKALCVNMPRIYDFRPGYGYEEIKDPFTDIPAPEDDGVFLMDLATGDSRLILSLAEAVDFLAANGEETVGRKVVINHITFNPSADRYLFLLRSMEQWPWLTWLVTADSNGGDLRYHNCWGMASHYHWRDDRMMLFYMMAGPKDPQLVLVDDETGGLTLINPDFFKADGHCSYSPNLKWMLYDSYPGPEPDYLRTLYVYSLERDKLIVLGRFRSEALPRENVDLRCDLHPRWMPDGKSISFDSVHEGFRGVYWMDLSGIVD
jgi:hypothetical protein